MTALPTTASAANTELARKIFANVRNVKTRVEANYIRPGIYWLFINRVRVGTSRKNDDYTAIELTVIRVLDDRMDHQLPGSRPHSVLESCTHMLMMKHEPSIGNFRAFLVGVTGIADANIDMDACTLVSTDANPLGGTVVLVDATSIRTRKGEPFTAVGYRREVPPAEVLEYLNSEKQGSDIKAALFPNEYLEKVIAAETAATA